MTDVTQIGAWSDDGASPPGLEHGTNPSGSVTIGAGPLRMGILFSLQETNGDDTPTLTIGTRSATYTNSNFLDDGVSDQWVKCYAFDEAEITAMSGTAVVWTMTPSPVDQSWGFGVFQNVSQAASPIFTPEGELGVDTLDVASVSNSADIIIGLMADKSANRAPLTGDTLTRLLAYNAAQVSHALFQGVGGDSPTRFQNDLVATSSIIATTIVLKAVTAGTPFIARRRRY